MNQRGLRALGYTQITVLTAAVGVGAIPVGAENVLLQSETQDVRYRDDNTAPTAAIGMILAAKTIYSFTVAEVSQMKFIEAAATAKLNVSFYGQS